MSHRTDISGQDRAEWKRFFLEEEDFQTAVDKFQGGFLEFDMIMKLDNSKTFVYF